MVDNLAVLIFGAFVVYTVYRAVQLDKIIPWFGEKKPEEKISDKDHPSEE